MTVTRNCCSSTDNTKHVNGCPNAVICPVVHLNGTSGAELLELRENAYSALSGALEGLKQMAPNGRDYYPKPGSMELATAQHTRRMQAITDIMRDIEFECEDINKWVAMKEESMASRRDQ